MFTYRISKRFSNFFLIELTSESIYEGQSKAWCLGETPILFRTDASSRAIAKKVCEDLNNETADHTLWVNDQPALCASKPVLESVVREWKRQCIYPKFHIAITKEKTPPHGSAGREVWDYVLGH